MMSSSRGSDLKYRAASGLVMVPAVLALTWWGGWPFTALWALAGLAILYEWSVMTRLERRPLWLAVCGLALMLAVVLVHSGALALAALAVLAGAVFGAAMVPKDRLWALCGALVAGASVVPVLALRGEGPAGMHAVLYLYAVVWATDIFAYFVGRTVGGPKLWPRVSPNKTWSGAMGGVIAGAVAGGLLAFFAGLPGIACLTALAVVLSVASQVGDLTESAAKRFFGVKDTSRLIPGHGGILDRLDGFIVAALLALLVALAHMAVNPAAGLLFW